MFLLKYSAAIAALMFTAAIARAQDAAVVLVYHRFGPVAADNMTVTTPVFEEQLRYLRGNGYAIVPLRSVVDFVAGRGKLPPLAVAITADDAHRSVFTEMKPIVERYGVPVTLFIYPSAISNASYAMTWEQLKELAATGLFDIESHSYWHPDFRQEKRRLDPDGYQRFVAIQLGKSRAAIEHRLGTQVDLLAWPFGIHDDELIAMARKQGYAAGFTIARHPAVRGGNVMAIPRYIVVERNQGASFASLLREAFLEAQAGGGRKSSQ